MKASLATGLILLGMFLTTGKPAMADYTYSTFAVPMSCSAYTGTCYTVPTAISDNGQIVGEFQNTLTPLEGFVDSAGTITVISAGIPVGINDSGQMVGTFGLYSGGVYTPLYYPNGSDTTPTAINNSGAIVGTYQDANGNTHGFLDSDGVFTTIDDPNAVEGPASTYGTHVTGINNLGQIVGTYQAANGDRYGFVDTGGIFATIEIPDASDTYFVGINDSDQLLSFGGVYQNGIYTYLDFPGEGAALGINDSGQVVGYTVDYSPCCQGLIGFLGTPAGPPPPVPEPATLPALAACLVGLAVVIRRRGTSKLD